MKHFNYSDDWNLESDNDDFDTIVYFPSKNELNNNSNKRFNPPVKNNFNQNNKNEILENEKEIIALFDINGFDKKDIELNISEDNLQLKIKKNNKEKFENKGFYLHHKNSFSFSKIISLPSKINPKKTIAKIKNGLLEITMPKIK